MWSVPWIECEVATNEIVINACNQHWLPLGQRIKCDDFFSSAKWKIFENPVGCQPNKKNLQ